MAEQELEPQQENLQPIEKSTSLTGLTALRGEIGERRSASLKNLSVSAEVCALCQKRVYPTERIIFNREPVHASCLRCNVCRRKLELGSYEWLDGEILCQADYRKKKNGPTAQTIVVSATTNPNLEDSSSDSGSGSDYEDLPSHYMTTADEAEKREEERMAKMFGV